MSMSRHPEPIPVAAKPEFRDLTEAQVQRALADPAPTNPVAVEVARLIEGYAANFKAHVERMGQFPARILRLKGCPIEEVAMRLVTEVIRAEAGGAPPDDIPF